MAFELIPVNAAENNVVTANNQIFEQFMLTGNVSNSDTATATLKNKPIEVETDDGDVVAIVGLPALFGATVTGRTVTVTALGNVGNTFATILIACRK